MIAVFDAAVFHVLQQRFTMSSPTRRYDLDWLRFLLFALLVPHHVAVGFVEWGDDIYRFRNDAVAGDGLSLFIFWSHSWRLPSLFLIAGIGTWFLTGRGEGVGFIGRRMARLLVPALFAMAMLNVFAGFAVDRMTGGTEGFFAFWARWLTEPTWWQFLHLWFLGNLAAYTLIAWPFLAFRDRLARISLPTWVLLGGLTLASALAILVLKPLAPAMVGENYQFAHYLILFFGGILIGAQHKVVLDWLARWAWVLVLGATLIFFGKLVLLVAALAADEALGVLLASGGWRPLGLSPPNAGLYSITEGVTAWAWCLAALGLAARYLNRSSPILQRLTGAVFPIYVLHFPVTLVLLALAAQVSLPWGVEFVVVTLLVYAITATLWILAERLGPAAYVIGGRVRG